VKAEADLALAKRSLERSRDLLKQGVAPQKEVEVAETVMRDAQSEFDRAKARLAQWGGSAGGVNETFTLKAPVSGEIVERSIHAGQEVRSDQMLAGMADVAAPLFVISDPAKLWVMLDVTEQDLPHLKVGQALEIHTQAYADKGFTGRLEVIGQALDADTRTIKVRGSVDNAGRLLKAQMYATIHVITPTPKHPRVPLKAVFLREGRPFVFVRHDAHTFEMRPISTLAEDGGHVLVNQGLKAGDEVVTEGSLALESVLEAATSTANES
jgi:cobalt-zinc-cadmium efflux system membrane fusion protein